jgi:hypothetical protein
MEEVLIKIYYKRTCTNYPWFVKTINALTDRNLVAQTLQPFHIKNWHPFELTRRGKEVVEALLNKEPE